MPRTSNDDDNRIGRARDEEGRFTSSGGTRQGRSRRDDDDDMRAGSGQGRGWHGDPEGHAEAGRHSHDNMRGSSRDDDDDRRRYASGAGRGNDRQRDEDGRFASGGRGGRLDEDEDFANWHAYGHDRGWHAHQQGRHGQMNRQRDDQGRFASGGRGGASRYDDDDDRMSGGGVGRARDNEGRFTGNGSRNH